MATKKPNISEVIQSDIQSRTITPEGQIPGKKEIVAKQKTETVSFRLTSVEKSRIERILAANGFTMAQGAKTALFQFIKTMEQTGK